MERKPLKKDEIKTESNTLPFIHGLYTFPRSGSEIEAESFKMIDREALPHHFSPEEWQVVRRMIHTSGDLSIMEAVKFSPNAIPLAIEALRKGHSIYVDSNMIRAGLSIGRLRSVCASYSPQSIVCHIADEDVVQQAHKFGLPCALFAVRKAKPILHGGITVFGNSPVALLELNRIIIEEGIRPVLVVAMPVGFVHVMESKQELMSLGVPYIAIDGRRGGSPLAVSVIHALCSLANPQNEIFQNL